MKKIVAAALLMFSMTTWAWSQNRSEEGRVGKEGRSRWSPHHLKKNQTAPLAGVLGDAVLGAGLRHSRVHGERAAAGPVAARPHLPPRCCPRQTVFFFFKQKTAYEMPK